VTQVEHVSLVMQGTRVTASVAHVSLVMQGNQVSQVEHVSLVMQGNQVSQVEHVPLVLKIPTAHAGRPAHHAKTIHIRQNQVTR
jgi:hypothetical protein